jgi:hypothetical protein
MALMISAIGTFGGQWTLRNTEPLDQKYKVCLAVVVFTVVAMLSYLALQLWVAFAVVFLVSLLWCKRAYAYKKADQGEGSFAASPSDTGTYKPVFAGSITSFV